MSNFSRPEYSKPDFTKVAVNQQRSPDPVELGLDAPKAGSPRGTVFNPIQAVEHEFPAHLRRGRGGEGIMSETQETTPSVYPTRWVYHATEKAVLLQSAEQEAGMKMEEWHDSPGEAMEAATAPPPNGNEDKKGKKKKANEDDE